MTMPPLPSPGQEPWDAALNAYLTALGDRIAVLETAPEYVFGSTAYQFSNQAPPATGSQLRLNNTNPSLATLIDARVIDSDGADRSQWFKILNTRSMVRINDWDNAAVYHRFNVTGPTTNDGTNVQIPVVWATGVGVIPNAKIHVGFIADMSAIVS